MYSSNFSLSLRFHVPTKASAMSAAVWRYEGKINGVRPGREGLEEEAERLREVSAPQAVLRSYWLDLYRLFVMSSGCAEREEEEGGCE